MTAKLVITGDGITDMVSVRERLYDLARALVAVAPEEAERANDLYLDVCHIIEQSGR